MTSSASLFRTVRFLPPRPAAVALISLFALLSGCTAVGPEHRVPDVPTGQGWLSQPVGDVDLAALAAWWRTLGDPDLEKVVDLALERNLDLRQADLNIEAARALLVRAEALSVPVVAANANAQRRRLSVNSPEYNPQRSPNQTVSDAGLDASWEIDLFGSLRRQRESAQASLQMSEADAAGLRISIAAETARTYFTLRGAQRELAARKASVDALQRIHGLVRDRQRAGDLPVSEVERAQSRLDQARAALPAIEARRQAAAIALGLLTGGLPESLVSLTTSSGAELVLNPLPVGERADILRRRPDVLSAERKLAAATADTGVATAELFPKLTLSASAGFRALGGSALFDSDSRRGALGPLITWRVFDGGRVRAEIRAAEARQEAAAVGYEKAVLTALSDAERALNQYDRSLQSITAQETAVASTRRAAETTRRRYELGDTTLTDTLDAQRELTDQQALLVQFKTNAASDAVALFKALGGGWTPSEKPGLSASRY
ncbi:efflux transporter outer membrane subunit [Propionivibrio soli]|uniref:efflux transporter outer membrane subunit n=1 Tax=Propionivibrio soli TaxID=2976531 RepID=UPI0021E87F66|nr:efflux transporter outer membrane subunit [Propionivibrio soli]